MFVYMTNYLLNFWPFTQQWQFAKVGSKFYPNPQTNAKDLKHVAKVSKLRKTSQGLTILKYYRLAGWVIEVKFK